MERKKRRGESEGELTDLSVDRANLVNSEANLAQSISGFSAPLTRFAFFIG